MFTIEKNHDELLLKMVNDWWFKAGVITYAEELLLKKVLHRTKEYSSYEKIELNVLRQKWIDYTQNGKYRDGMPEFLKR